MKEHSAILPHYSLDTPILQLAKDCSLSIRQAFEGVQIFGGTGSGKTSGSGRTLAHGFLQLGFGGLVLCAKPDEANNWRRYAAETGREDSFLFIDGSPGQGFNFLEYEMKAYQHEGIGLHLVRQVCKRCDWQIAIEPHPSGGMSASLHVMGRARGKG